MIAFVAVATSTASGNVGQSQTVVFAGRETEQGHFRCQSNATCENKGQSGRRKPVPRQRYRRTSASRPEADIDGLGLVSHLVHSWGPRSLNVLKAEPVVPFDTQSSWTANCDASIGEAIHV